MDGYPIFAICFGIPLFIIGMIVLALSIFLKQRSPGVKKYRAIFVAAIVILSAGMGAFMLQMYMDYKGEEASRHVDLDYDVTLSLNGSGQVRVSLPLPITESFYETLQVSPSSSAYMINRTGAQPRLDVEMSAETTIHGHLYGLRADIKEELTWTTPSGSDRCHDGFASNISVQILGGNVTSVYVLLRAEWESPCSGSDWRLECWARPGADMYSGEFWCILC